MQKISEVTVHQHLFKRQLAVSKVTEGVWDTIHFTAAVPVSEASDAVCGRKTRNSRVSWSCLLCYLVLGTESRT